MSERYFVTEKKGRKKEHVAVCIDKAEAEFTMQQFKQAYPDSIYYLNQVKDKR